MAKPKLTHKDVLELEKLIKQEQLLLDTTTILRDRVRAVETVLAPTKACLETQESHLANVRCRINIIRQKV
jgi:hypothetical protein